MVGISAARAWGARGVVALGLLAAFAAQAQTAPAVGNADFRGREASGEARQIARWAAEAGDAGGRPFAIVDKKAAQIYVFGADGLLVEAAPALLGQAKGDEAAPGVGRMVATGIPAMLRTTPAGRFESEPGHNLRGEAIVWVDYEAAVAIHRLRPTAPGQRRLERLSSGSPEDNRISLGCIVVDPAFYDEVVAPTLGRQRGIVYVLPDTRPWQAVFSGAAVVTTASAATPL
ncbi:hypothetical protein [Roseateles violae]|uniref:L,D-transpeptidase n=1 Tax=Roseateles violae TaxID=3058042 RepID=A0ABT8DZI6_9BURK|nr:hypothetical protein [Pelomonas sp. PFR6]MDN3922960.1 hypothetical protein [Pelomonas sp. PFR6]